MCKKLWDWLFSRPDPVPGPPGASKHTALLFAINDYPGGANDLNGCINDGIDWEKKLNEAFPGFVIKKFKDSKVTRSCFITEITKAINELVAKDTLLVLYSGHGTQTYDVHGDEADGYDEAVYLYDGMVIDDDIKSTLMKIPDDATVVLLFDSCFSGTITRIPVSAQHRFYRLPGMPIRRKKRIRIPKEDMKWIVISGCGEQQTSADAYINGRYNGAFTYFALKAIQPGQTYLQWFNEIRKYLPSKDYEQAPTLEGKTELFNNLIFM